MTYITVDVDVDRDQFHKEEIASYLRNEGYKLIEKIFELYRNNKPIDTELRELFYKTIGRIA